MGTGGVTALKKGGFAEAGDVAVDGAGARPPWRRGWPRLLGLCLVLSVGGASTLLASRRNGPDRSAEGLTLREASTGGGAIEAATDWLSQSRFRLAAVPTRARLIGLADLRDPANRRLDELSAQLLVLERSRDARNDVRARQAAAASAIATRRRHLATLLGDLAGGVAVQTVHADLAGPVGMVMRAAPAQHRAALLAYLKRALDEAVRDERAAGQALADSVRQVAALTREAEAVAGEVQALGSSVAAADSSLPGAEISAAGIKRPIVAATTGLPTLASPATTRDRELTGTQPTAAPALRPSLAFAAERGTGCPGAQSAMAGGAGRAVPGDEVPRLIAAATAITTATADHYATQRDPIGPNDISPLIRPVRDATIVDDALPGGLFDRGVVLEVSCSQQVEAPFGGVVVFARPFKAYGLVLIIDREDGYHVLLARMTRLDVAEGARVVAGQTVGSIDVARGTRLLYEELRRHGRSIDPATWMATRQDKVPG